MKIKVSDKFQAKWIAFRKALDEAAKPFTNSELALPPFYAHDIGGSFELDKALKDKPINSHVSFSQNDERQLYIEIIVPEK